MLTSLNFSGVLEWLSSWNSLVSLFGVAALAGVQCGCGCNHGGEDDKNGGHDDDDSVYGEIEAKIEELKGTLETASETDKLEIHRDLGDTILALAIQLQRDDYLEESDDAYQEAIQQLHTVLQAQPDSNEEIRRLCGLANLSHAVVLNDLDQKENAIEGYEKARGILEPLATKGDGEAKYDIAGIKLNQGILYHEIDELDKALKLLDESFTEFRALEKISELDTRYYMGKVSVALGNLYRDQNEPIEKIVDMYNRAMRLFVELIDAGDIHHEIDLANALVDKCTARYDAAAQSGAQSEGQAEKEAILKEMQEALRVYEKLMAEDNPEAYYDAFGAKMSYAIMLDDCGQYDEAIKVFDEIQEKYKDWENADDPMILNEYAELYERRGQTLTNMGKAEEAIQYISKAIDIREKFWEDEWGLTPDDLLQFAPSLASAYCNRATLYDQLGKKELVLADCKSAMNVLDPYKEDLEEDFDELANQIEIIQKKAE